MIVFSSSAVLGTISLWEAILERDKGVERGQVGMNEDVASCDMPLRDLSQWAGQQAKRLAQNFGLDASGDSDFFALAQTVKLGEEVGELHAEVLGALRYHRPDKADRFGADTLAGEVADVMVCLALLSQILHVDLAKAVSEKVDYLEARNRVAAAGTRTS
jgi:NTP pyrophosphatase (non-canonical NTP hydrolase)